MDYCKNHLVITFVFWFMLRIRQIEAGESAFFLADSRVCSWYFKANRISLYYSAGTLKVNFCPMTTWQFVLPDFIPSFRVSLSAQWSSFELGTICVTQRLLLHKTNFLWNFPFQMKVPIKHTFMINYLIK